MRPGGATTGDRSDRDVPIAVQIARKEPACDLAAGELQAWLQAAGPSYRLSQGEDITRPGHVLYDAMYSGQRVGYLHLYLPRRRNTGIVVRLRVELAWQRRGIGRQLVQTAAARERESRRRLFAEVPLANRAVNLFLAAVGWRRDPEHLQQVVGRVGWTLEL